MAGQEAAPLYEGLRAYLGRAYAGFHTPGHRGRLPGLAGIIARLDLTELPLQPGGASTPVLAREAESLAAALFGAERTYFLTNGASAGIMAMLLGTVPPGSVLTIGRDCHVSVVRACVLGDLRPDFLFPERRTEWAFPLGVDPVRAAAALRRGATVVLTNPVYQGIVWDLDVLAGAGGSLLVDEAHGAHLAFGRHGGGARAAGAAAWVHGSHKTLGSLTQTGMLHLGPGGREEAGAWLERLSTTSPSYPLLASLDLARRWAAREGRAAWERAAARMAGIRGILRRSVRVLDEADLPNGARLDPAKLTVLAPSGGHRTARRLLEDHGIQVEAAGLDWLTFLVTPFHSDREIRRLVEALPRVLAAGGTAGPRWPSGLPRRALWPREAALAPRRYLPLARAAGEIASEPLCPYPPGIPLVWPGEIIEDETIGSIEATLAGGGEVTGLDPRGVPVVQV